MRFWLLDGVVLGSNGMVLFLMYGLMDVWVLLADPAWGASVEVALAGFVPGFELIVFKELGVGKSSFWGAYCKVNSSFVLASVKSGSLCSINFGNWMALFRLKFSFLCVLDPLWCFL
ncbi:hypothetical protein Nepgr_025998 [Nepenthes gracilis]|uniref:Transmembrane protein n=1 Tax=Nepenthes gracilis TaxID=150966 RepID=A0AAD3T654_NEPGR|nr:hypothetical protein Nepgr_025998 [Nepenthes gracilis]